MGLCEYFWNCWNFQAPQSEATLLIRGQKDYRNSDGGGGDGVKVLGMVSWHHLGFTNCYLQMATSSLTTHRVTHLKGFHDNEADFSSCGRMGDWQNFSEIVIHINMIISQLVFQLSQICSNGVRSGVCWGHLSTANFLSCWRSQLRMIWAAIVGWVHCGHEVIWLAAILR